MRFFPPGYIARNASTSLLNSVVSAVAAAVCLPLLVSELGITDYAHWAALGLFLTIGEFLDLGLSRAMIASLAPGPSPRSHQAFSACVGLSLVLGVGGTIACLAIALTGAPIWGDQSFLAVRSDYTLLVCGAVLIPLVTLTSSLRATLEAAFRLEWVNIGYVAQVTLNYGLVLAVAAVTHNEHAVLWTSVGVFAVIFVAHLALAASLPHARLVRPDRAMLRNVIRLAWESCLIVTPMALTLPVLTYSYLRHAGEAAEYGDFDLAMKVTRLATSTLATLAVPVFAIVAAAGEGSYNALRSFVANFTFAMFALFALGFSAFYWLGGPILEMAFPDHGYTVHQAALIALAGAGTISIVEPLTRALLGLGHVRLLAASRVALLVTTFLIAAGLAGVVNIVRFPLAYALGSATAAAITWLGYAVMVARRESSGRTPRAETPKL
jgi:O-antigen/teichoic acid export membrane protein